MSNDNNKAPAGPISLVGQDPASVRTPSLGSGILYTGFDGAIWGTCTECDVEGGKNKQGPISQFAYTFEVNCPPDPDTGETVLDVNGQPINGQVIRHWAEYQGVDKKQKSLMWKWLSVLQAMGIYTKEQIEQAIAAANQGNDEFGKISPQDWAAAQVGRSCGIVLVTKRLTDNTLASRANGVIGKEAFDKAWNTKGPDGHFVARRPATEPPMIQQAPTGPGGVPGVPGVPNFGGAPAAAGVPSTLPPSTLPGALPGSGMTPPAGSPTLPGFGGLPG